MSKLPPFVYNFKELFLFVAWDWDTVNILFLAAPWRRSQRGTSTAISPGRLRNYGGRNGMGRFCTQIYLECKYTFGFRFMVFNVTFNNISVFLVEETDFCHFAILLLAELDFATFFQSF
jgi:hypothetical protein